MIGFFDSGLGGLTILHEVMERQPGEYIYLGDNLRAPYGARAQAEILNFTTQGVKWLIDQGCRLVILACNTASANALHEIQQNWLPTHAPHVRVLGILVPTIEAITGLDWRGTHAHDQDSSILIFATPSTAASGAYEREIKKRLPKSRVVVQACPELVPLIEAGAPRARLEERVKEYVQEGRKKLQIKPNAVLLGCTHYHLMQNAFRHQFEESVEILSQPRLVEASLQAYLFRHPEFASQEVRPTRFFTSGDPLQVAKISAHFFGEPIVYEQVTW